MPKLTEQLAAATRAQTPATGREKRRAPRIRQRGRVSIIPLEQGRHPRAVPVLLRDVSCRGVRLIHGQHSGPGEQFILLLPAEAGRPVPILCRVVHCQPESGTTWCIGAEFVCIYSAETSACRVSDEELERIRCSVLS